MKVVRIFLRIIAYLMLIGFIGFVVLFALVNLNIIDNPYEKKPDMVSLSQSEIRLKRNSTFQLTAKAYPDNTRNRKIKYTSDKPEIASVNEVTGYVEAHKNGAATITASLDMYKDIKAECVVIVSDNNVEINSITVNPKNINIQEGKKYQIRFKMSPAEATLHDIEYYTSDPEVAEVDSLGVITGKKEGQAFITVSDKVSGVTDEALVKVYKAENLPRRLASAT